MDQLAKLGIDGWGMLVYLVNFGILWLVMAYLVFPKVIKMMDARRKQIQDNLTTAERIQKELDKTLTKATADQAKLKLELEAERAELDKEMTMRRSELLANADADRAQLLEEARAIIKSEKKLLVDQAEGDMINLIQRVLVKILGEKISPEDVERSVKQAWEEQKQEVLK
jgi:F0F1-type ATP synthase membrane subunit b/b'